MSISKEILIDPVTDFSREAFKEIARRLQHEAHDGRCKSNDSCQSLRASSDEVLLLPLSNLRSPV